MKTVRELYRKLNNNNQIPDIEGQGNFTADQMIWFAEQAVKFFTIPNTDNNKVTACCKNCYYVNSQHNGHKCKKCNNYSNYKNI